MEQCISGIAEHQDERFARNSWWERTISGSAGAWSIPIRVLLGGIEAGYRMVVARRNHHFDQPQSVARIPVPVISVGNITVGGTGKTPLVIDLVNRLERSGHRPAVVARGYGSKPGLPNDEEILVRKHNSGVIYISDADRVRGAGIACQRDGANVIVLDDGFQHRRLARNLDIVVIDATCPFGHEHLLPRGLLREPPSGLARADVIVISRSDQIAKSELTTIESRIARMVPRAARLRSRHKVVEVRRMDGRVVEGAADGSLRGKRAVVFAAIGRPRAFLRTVESLGATVVATRWWRDHHRYKVGDIHEIVVPGKVPPFDVILTTEKDAVKLAALSGYDPAAIMVVHVAIDFLDEGSRMLDESLKIALNRSPKS